MMEAELAELAAAYGVAVDYWDQSGQHVSVAPETVTAVLAALGVDASTPQSRRSAVEDASLRSWRRILPPVVVARQGFERIVPVHLSHGTGVRAWVDLEDGSGRDLAQADIWVEPRWVDGEMIGEASFVVPADLPLGWHRLVVETAAGISSCPLVMTPYRLEPPALAHGRLWGFSTQVYSVRSTRSWGMGDLADLADLASWSGNEHGAGFVLVNPMHATSPVPPVVPSPYLPVTRRFASPLYLRIESVPEYAIASSAMRDRIDALAEPLRAASRTADLIDRDAVLVAKLEALKFLRDVPMSMGRACAYDAFVAQEDPGLTDFATWCAIVEIHGFRWQDWPADLQDPASPAVVEFREKHAARVDFHRWLQWLLDEQFRAAEMAASDAGMPAGVIHDLAVGVHPEGADSWALQSVLAPGVSVGAPPDMYNQMGQNWSQPPWRPDALEDAAYVPYRDMLRTVLRRAGGLRIDHVLGLFRLWWVPEGMSARDGTYVRYDHDALVGILALEAHRAGALIVGEDLGTVEPWIQDVLRDRGLLGTSILWFERWDSGDIKRPEDWRSQVLASVTVHDLPPTAGYLEGEHVRIRAELGLLAHGREAEEAAARREWADWGALLVERGFLSSIDAPVEERVVALHRLLAQSPSVMLAVALPDLVGDLRAQNQPGTDQEYPNWRVPLGDARGDAVLLDDLPGYPPTVIEALGMPRRRV